MTRSLLLIPMIILAGCASSPAPHAADESLLVTRFPGLPDDAQGVAERLASCVHFGGEINGDGSAHDREVASAMTRLRCDTVDQDVAAIRRSYGDNRAVQDALEAASQF